jgi:hypothetical protein
LVFDKEIAGEGSGVLCCSASAYSSRLLMKGTVRVAAADVLRKLLRLGFGFIILSKLDDRNI